MNETDTRPIKLPNRIYDMIESKVADLYSQLKITKFPINPFEIVKKKGIRLIPYSKLNEEQLKTLYKLKMCGLNHICKDGVFQIYYDDSYNKERQRFTIMHEIGHIELGHKEDSDLAEICANHFASYALAPTPIIGRYNCLDYIDISKKFFVSRECAEIIMRRFENWTNIPIDLKPHEERIREMFVW